MTRKLCWLTGGMGRYAIIIPDWTGFEPTSKRERTKREKKEGGGREGGGGRRWLLEGHEGPWRAVEASMAMRPRVLWERA